MACPTVVHLAYRRLLGRSLRALRRAAFHRLVRWDPLLDRAQPHSEYKRQAHLAPQLGISHKVSKAEHLRPLLGSCFISSFMKREQMSRTRQNERQYAHFMQRILRSVIRSLDVPHSPKIAGVPARTARPSADKANLCTKYRCTCKPVCLLHDNRIGTAQACATARAGLFDVTAPQMRVEPVACRHDGVFGLAARDRMHRQKHDFADHGPRAHRPLGPPRTMGAVALALWRRPSVLRDRRFIASCAASIS
jgi:hypothetical protein